VIEDILLKIADKIVRLDEASLSSLWDKYRQRVENVEVSREWEKAVIIFFIINAVRAKNEILNEYIQEKNKSAPHEKKPNLRLIKTPR